MQDLELLGGGGGGGRIDWMLKKASKVRDVRERKPRSGFSLQGLACPEKKDLRWKDDE